jgi:hypothetical protein
MVTEFSLGASEIEAIFATIAVTFVFLGWGQLLALVHGEHELGVGEIAFDVAAGWGTVSLLMVVADLIRIPLAPAAWTLSAVGFCGLAITWRLVAHPWQRWALFGAVIALCSSLLVVAAVTPALLYDEFEHWLPNAHFLYAFGVLPSASHPNPGSGIPAYPYGGPFVTYFASLFAGQWLDGASKLFSVLLFGLFGSALATEIDRDRSGGPRWAILGAAVAIATVLDPGFDPRFALSSYMDSPSGVLCALAALAAWHGLNAFERGDSDKPRVWFRRAGYVGLALVYTRDTNLVLLGGLGLGALAAGMRLLLRDPIRAVRLSASFVVIPAAGFLLWRIFRAVSGLPAPLPILPISQWQWDAFPLVLKSEFIQRLAAHPLLGSSALLAIVGLLAIALWAKASQALRTIIGVTAATWVLFLAWAYTATMNPGDVSIAISFWRYFSQLFPLFLLLIVSPARTALTRPWCKSLCFGWRAVVVTIVPVFLMLGAPIATASYWRNDCNFPDVAAARRIADALAPDLSTSARVYVVHAAEPEWLALAISYELQIDRSRVVGAHLAASVAAIEAVPAAAAIDTTLVLDLRPLQRDALRQAGEVPSVDLYRLSESADGRRTLKLVASAPSMPLGPVCSFPTL